MKKCLLVLTLLCSFSGILAMENDEGKSLIEIILPDAQTLEKRLCSAGFGHFVEKTDVIKDLLDFELDPDAVFWIVEDNLTKYNQYMNEAHTAACIQRLKPLLIETVLMDYPEAFQQLKSSWLS